MILTKDNYFSLSASQSYMSCSQYKSLIKCQASAVMEINGEWEREASTAMLQGSYFDAWVEGTLDDYKETHPEMFLKSGKNKGELRSDFAKVEECIERAKIDDLFMEHLKGDKQVVLTGEIGGVPFKGMLDILNVDKKRIVDTKLMSDFKRKWNVERRDYVNWVEQWEYDLQAAIYWELARQNGMKDFTYVIAAVTKETWSDLQLVRISRERMKEKLEEVEAIAPFLQNVKLGILEPERCEKCDYCKSSKKLARVLEMEELDVLYD